MMGAIVNLDLIQSPLNWVIVFLILYFLALAAKYISDSLNAAGIATV